MKTHHDGPVVHRTANRGVAPRGLRCTDGDTRSVSQWLDAPDDPSAQITVDLTNPNSASMGITMYLSGLPDGAISFKELGKTRATSTPYLGTNRTVSDIIKVNDIYEDTSRFTLRGSLFTGISLVKPSKHL